MKSQEGEFCAKVIALLMRMLAGVFTWACSTSVYMEESCAAASVMLCLDSTFVSVKNTGKLDQP